MRKTILGRDAESDTFSGNEWLQAEAIAEIGVTSEAEDAPVENIIYADRSGGWRAGEPGPQTIRITFARPRNIGRIQLRFTESQVARTQEFSLRCTVAGGERKEVARQQWTFSPQGSTAEAEDYRVDLREVAALELVITPDISHGSAHASLTSLRVG